MADTGWEGKHLQTKAERFVGFKRLGFQALPEFWTFQMAAGFLMSIILNIADAITELLTDTLGVAITSANFTKCLFTWQGLLIVELLMLAIATSIDALTVGIAFASLSVNIWTSVSLIGVTTFVFSIAGVLIGNQFGMRYRKPSQIAGGIILILIGTKVLLEHLGILVL